MNEILLLSHFTTINPFDELGLLVQFIRVDIIRADLVIRLFFTGRVGLVFLWRIRFDSGVLADLACPVNVRQSAALLVADSRVGIVWAFMNVAIRTFSALLAVTKSREVAAYRRARCYSDMRVPALRVGTSASEEM